MKQSRQFQMAQTAPRVLAQGAPTVPQVIGYAEHNKRTQQPLIRRANVAPNAGVAQVQQPAPNPLSGGFNGQRVERLTVASTPAQIYGCTGLFDLCGDADLMALSLQGNEPFLDWLGWEATSVCRIQKNFITWQRPAYSSGSPTAGYVSDPCADGNGIDWGTCDFILTDFGRLRRVTPARDLTRVGLRLCEAQPRYRLDGTPINDDTEYDTRIVTEVLLQDLKRLIVSGNKTTGGQFDGLERLVNTGYTGSDGQHCSMMDSIVIQWNGNTLSGGSGVTWNGAAVGTGFNFVDVLIAAYRRIRQRIGWSPTLSAQRLGVGDIAFVAPTHVNQCLLDQYTCWRVCPGAQYTESNLNSLEAREFRNNLNGGLYGAGRIFLDGFEIPLINYDWGLIKGPTRSDAYLLTGRVGNVRTINGQYNDMRVAQGALPGWYDVTDGGRLLTWVDTDNTCFTRTVEMDPRLLMWAPWAQTRFQNIDCRQPGPLLSSDPTESSFFPETSFISAGS